MIAHVLQDWTTLRGSVVFFGIRQSPQGWLDLDGFRDLTAWVDVKQVTSGAGFSVNLETSPSEDESLFRTLASTSAAAAGLTVAISRGRAALAAGGVPLERFVRWAVVGTPGGNWSLTFRILVCLNPVSPEFSVTRDGQTFGNPLLPAGAGLSGLGPGGM